jgi:hypothetical protein
MPDSEAVARRRAAVQTLVKVATAIVETVAECPQGAPGGVLYAALMSRMSLQTFEQIMAGLVDAKRLRRSGELYFAVPK